MPEVGVSEEGVCCHRHYKHCKCMKCRCLLVLKLAQVDVEFWDCRDFWYFGLYSVCDDGTETSMIDKIVDTCCALC